MNSDMQQRLKTVGPFPAAMTDEELYWERLALADAPPVWTLCEFCEGLIAPDDGCVEC
jgi:hypothetical protein